MSRPIFTYAYNNQFDPAMLVIEVGLSLLQQSQAATHITALVDSGSDISLPDRFKRTAD